MAALDAYITQLAKTEALEAELLSDERARIVVKSGEIRTKKAIPHEQIASLIQEVVTPDSQRELMTTGRTSFRYETAGLSVTVMVDARRPGAWSVQLLPVGVSMPPPKAASVDTASAGSAKAKGPEAAAFTDVEPTSLRAAPRGGAAEEAHVARESASPSRPGRPPRPARPAPPAPRAVAAPSAAAGAEPRINAFLRTMTTLGASDLHLCSGVAPMIRHDGEMQQLDDSGPLSDAELREMIKEIAPEHNAEEFAETCDADFAHTIEGVARFRVNAFMDRHGAGVVCRRIPFEILSPEQIALPKAVLDLCWLSKGLVVVTGPTGSGKSTTLATLIDYINKNRTDHIITIEDPIEFVHDNQRCLINQREVKTHTRSFSAALRAALREDPDIVLVGEMRDLETVAIAIETAETGHLVFGTLHTTTAISTVDRIIDQFPADQQAQIRIMLSESLSGVIAQVLCKQTGGGRCAAYEVLISTPAVSNLIREGKTFQIASTMQTSRNLGMQTMNEHLVELVTVKKISPEEAYIKSVDKMGLKMMFTQAGIEMKLGGDS